MLPTAHLALHLTLCQSLDKLRDSANFPVRVEMISHLDKAEYDNTFTVQRGTSDIATVDFDAPRGLYLMRVVAGGRCAASDVIYIFPQHARDVSETLTERVPMQQPTTVLAGTAPMSFLYLKPTLVFFNHGTACNTQVGDQISYTPRVEYDNDSYYVWLTPSQQLPPANPPVMAFEIATPTGEFHYIRLRTPVPTQGMSIYELDLGDDIVDWLSSQPTDTLLCPKIYETSVH